MSRNWKVRIPLSGAAALLVVLVGAPPLIRVPIVLWFLAVCPGMAVVAHVGAARNSTRWTLAIVLSAAIDMLVAEIFLYARHWYPTLALFVLAVIATAAIVDARLPGPRPLPVRRIPSVEPDGAPFAVHEVTATEPPPRPFYVSDVNVALAAHGEESHHPSITADRSPGDPAR